MQLQYENTSWCQRKSYYMDFVFNVMYVSIIRQLFIPIEF